MPFELENAAEVVMRQKKVGIDFQCPANLRFRLGGVVGGEVDPAGIGIDDERERVELDRALHFSDRGIELSEAH